MGRNWNEREWSARDAAIRDAVRRAGTPEEAWQALTRGGRAILRNYSTSFFLVTRFLPPKKRSQVEIIYAAVRYPDEVVDTFPLPPDRQLKLLGEWREGYDRALETPDWRAAIESGAAPWAAGFAEVVRRNAIPPVYYHAFLDAMAADANPHPYRDLDDLIEGYIYGSAIVVGYFLAYVYGASDPSAWPRALGASRDLGIALQLTNFLRDAGDDRQRGRVYLPVRDGVSTVADAHYGRAENHLDAFAADCRPAIQACIDVYRRLNRRLGENSNPAKRQSVPLIEKFHALPASKYWRVPMAYLGAL